MSMTQLHGDTGWVCIAGVNDSNGLYYRVKNGFCTVFGDGGSVWNGNPKANAEVLLATLPAEARPSLGPSINVLCGRNKGVALDSILKVYSDGRVTLYTSVTNTSGYWNGSITYPVL
ncbi:hypothetical protein [Parafannyhessea umbonata]|uniref:Uncharacterized protein n=1 Tax=Parafannyhessea umbonata TaxID=604330 RepID=A0A1H1L5J9_9ACTN|nr:hypothetical protein [Parafannyhessea umbonata]SDR69763.1 hypothetical protein SAMN04489857_0707 [Parafannyhessea umbonata]